MTALLKDHPFPHQTKYARRVDIFKTYIKVERRTGWFTYKASQASRRRLQALIERNGIRPSVVTGSGHYSFLAADKQDLESSAWDNWKRAMAEREAEQKQTFEVGQMVRVTDDDGSFTAIAANEMTAVAAAVNDCETRFAHADARQRARAALDVLDSVDACTPDELSRLLAAATYALADEANPTAAAALVEVIQAIRKARVQS